ncbi:MAG TPA: tetratricopeptide repeat protein [Dyella sp.]|uniref:tetratricopeptide repeat protein n=1 Tax=Dyella sp. TaxID=1869338 RepID=UPI002CF34A41|nr:tetratricopeptide repeat protein [Dyella sp.]HTV85272.1 tetratricopeptide repeat protein [Dyella sp.]
MASACLRMGFALLALGWGAAAHPQTESNAPAPAPAASARSPVDDAAQEQLLQQAMTQIRAGKNADAIHGPLAQIIHTYETAYAHSKMRIYCAQSMTEALLYMGMASSKHQQSAQVLSKPTWAMAYYLSGYAYGSMGDMAHSEASLKQALLLSPFNSQFLSELGNVYENEKNWPSALEAFQSADAAAEFAPPEQKIALRCHALRGQGYVLVELHKLDEAAQKYNDCLRIKPGDEVSIRELGYVWGLQVKAAK